jgi:ribosomal protein S26
MDKNKEQEEKVVRCDYCGKILKPDEIIKDTIWVNHGQYEMIFCSKEHACYRQMSAEG